MQPLIVDSVTQLGPGSAGRIAVGGSHCGTYAAYLAAKAGLRGVILNDAGVGRDRAGIAGLAYLAALGMPAATVGHDTARIGDGADCAARGRISYANGIAIDLGCAIGQPAAVAARILGEHAAPRPAQAPPAIEARHRLEGDWPAGTRVWALDSASLVRDADAGAIVVTGSHGGLLGGNPASAIRVDARAVLYNDAAGGIDGAGFTRLPALDRRGIAAATVDAMRARIGDGRSSYADGVLTQVNETAFGLGARPGMAAAEFVRLVAEAASAKQGRRA